MSKSDMGAGVFGLLFLGGTIFAWISAGTIAWDWVSPKGFGGGLLFLILWLILGRLFDLILGMVLLAVVAMFDS